MRIWFGFLVALCVTAAAEDVLKIDGVSRPIKDEILSMLVAGRLDAVHVRAGSRVKKGDILVELDRRAEELEVARRKLLMDGKIEVEAAKARVATLGKNLKDTKELYDRTKSVSREEVEKLELEHRLAQAEVEATELKEEREKIEHDVALHLVSRRTLHSPLSGIVTEKLRELGETCQPHEPLLRIVDVSRCYFVVHAGPKVTTSLELEEKFQIEFKLGKGPIIVEGEICYISPTADPASGLIEVRLIFLNPDEQIPAGIDGIISIPVR
jgi:RND family efflux transporter MFP subunit